MADRNRVEPESQLCEFDRHWIQVDSKDASFDDPPLPVGESRFVARACIGLLISGVGIGRDFFRKVLASSHQEVARSHSRIEDAQLQYTVAEIAAEAMQFLGKSRFLVRYCSLIFDFGLPDLFIELS